MIRQARGFFLSRALREKILIVAFIAIGVGWWGSALSTRMAAFWREQKSTTVNLAIQNQWINNQSRIEETAKQTVSSLDATKTLNGNQLVTTVIQMGKEAGLNIRIYGNLENSVTGQFTVHSQEYDIRDVEWDALKRFYEALQRRSPYIAVDRFILESPNNLPRHLLRLRVTAVEIKR